jgi:hypothetical protein
VTFAAPPRGDENTPAAARHPRSILLLELAPPFSHSPAWHVLSALQQLGAQKTAAILTTV